jgi:transcriptional regulator with XRE-family HTH domain
MNNSSPFVGQKIKVARKIRGLSLTQVGDLIGITNQALSAIERGKANPSRQTLISLAQLFKSNLGEEWLSPYAGIPQREKTQNPYSPSTWAETYLGMTIEEFWEIETARDLPRPVLIADWEKTTHVPIHYQITDGVTLSPADEKMYATVSRSMIPSLVKARAVLVLEKPILDALVTPGDVLILTECSEKVDDRVVLALVNHSVMIRRWSAEGRKIILSPLYQDYGTITVSRKEVKCVGEVTGLLRYFK